MGHLDNRSDRRDAAAFRKFDDVFRTPEPGKPVGGESADIYNPVAFADSDQFQSA
jgi:hypothetical protein